MTITISNSCLNLSLQKRFILVLLLVLSSCIVIIWLTLLQSIPSLPEMLFLISDTDFPFWILFLKNCSAVEHSSEHEPESTSQIFSKLKFHTKTVSFCSKPSCGCYLYKSLNASEKDLQDKNLDSKHRNVAFYIQTIVQALE